MTEEYPTNTDPANPILVVFVSPSGVSASSTSNVAYPHEGGFVPPIAPPQEPHNT